MVNVYAMTRWDYEHKVHKVDISAGLWINKHKAEQAIRERCGDISGYSAPHIVIMQLHDDYALDVK